MRSFREEVFEILQTQLRIVALPFQNCGILAISLTSLFSPLNNGGKIILVFSFAEDEMKI